MSASGAAIWAECRGYALGFLREAAERTAGRQASAWDAAIEQYAKASISLQEVARLFPPAWEATEEELARNAKDTDRRRQAAQHVKQAKDAEVAGAAALKDIVESL